MKHLKILPYGLTIVALLGIALLFSASPAQAQAVGNVDVRVTVPSVLQLRYYSELVIHVSENHFAGVVFGTTDDTDDAGSVTVASWDDDAAITASWDRTLEHKLSKMPGRLKRFEIHDAGSNLRVTQLR